MRSDSTVDGGERENEKIWKIKDTKTKKIKKHEYALVSLSTVYRNPDDGVPFLAGFGVRIFSPKRRATRVCIAHVCDATRNFYPSHAQTRARFSKIITTLGVDRGKLVSSFFFFFFFVCALRFWQSKKKYMSNNRPTGRVKYAYMLFYILFFRTRCLVSLVDVHVTLCTCRLVNWIYERVATAVTLTFVSTCVKKPKILYV